eukprot:scaffold1578_cov286-Pinguiococcus_pyrenoidosus.AAC.2
MLPLANVCFVLGMNAACCNDEAHRPEHCGWGRRRAAAGSVYLRLPEVHSECCANNRLRLYHAGRGKTSVDLVWSNGLLARDEGNFTLP